MSKKIKVKCPQCETEFNYYDSEFRPFCSEKCKMIDLGHWFQEIYTVPTREPLDSEDQEKVIRELEKGNESDDETSI